MRNWMLMPGVLRAWWKFRTYKQLSVHPKLIYGWLHQYPKDVRSVLLKILRNMDYYGESDVESALVESNASILARLEIDGIGLKNVIYVQHDEAGSSSPVMLNLLRDAARLERSGANFIDGRDQDKLSQVTADLNTGAIIYVDDFVGSGNQLIHSHEWAAQFIAGSFSEFFLGVVICEEGRDQLIQNQIEPISSRFHLKAERPLSDQGTLLTCAERERINDIGSKLFGKYHLGYRNLGTNIAFYRNTPNSTPVIFRGNIKQKPNFGVIPRTTDL